VSLLTLDNFLVGTPLSGLPCSTVHRYRCHRSALRLEYWQGWAKRNRWQGTSFTWNSLSFDNHTNPAGYFLYKRTRLYWM